MTIGYILCTIKCELPSISKMFIVGKIHPSWGAKQKGIETDIKTRVIIQILKFLKW